MKIYSLLPLQSSSPSVSPMPDPSDLQTKFGPSFSDTAKEDGEALLENQPPETVRTSPEHCSVEIFDGDELYEVDLRLENRKLVWDCQCGAATPCAHAWATLLTATRFAEDGCLSKVLKRNVPKELLARQNATNENDKPVKKAEKKKPDMRAALAALRDLQNLETSKQPEEEEPKSTTTVFYALSQREHYDGATELRLNLFWAQKGRGPRFDRNHSYQLQNAPSSDTDLHNLLRSCPQHSGGGDYLLSGRTGHLVLQAAAKTNHLYWEESISPISPDDRGNWNVVFSLEKKAEDCFTATYCFQQGTELIRNPETALVLETGLALTHDRLISFSAPGTIDNLMRIRKAGGSLELSKAQALLLARKLTGSNQTAGHDICPELEFELVHIPLRPQLHVKTAKFKYRGREQLHAQLCFDYQGTVVNEREKAAQIPLPNQKLLERNLEEEAKLRDLLVLLGLRWNGQSGKEEIGWKLLPAELDRVVHQLIDQDWLVTAEGKTCRKPVDMQLTLSSGEDWFDLQGGIEFDDETNASLPILLLALRNQATYVRLDDGTLGLLPKEWLENYTVLLEIGEADGEKIRFRREQAILLDSLLDERNVEMDAAYQQTIKRLHNAGNPTPADPPPDFQGSLRPYQRQGLGWLLYLNEIGLGGCLADDMGLGKTVQVLALLETRRQARVGLPSLIILPKSLIFNWQAEAQRFTPKLRVLPYWGANRSTKNFNQTDLVLMTYGTLRQDVEEIAKIRFDYCILDESQAIKNAETVTAKAVRGIRAQHRLAMTGTPIENRLTDLFSQFDFLNPGLFGSQHFLAAGSQNQINPEELDSLRNALRPLLLRRTKKAVLTELPEKDEQLLFCELGDEQRVHYDELREFYRGELLDKEKSGKIEILAALTRLRQAACHPGLVSRAGMNCPSAKLEVLLERIELLTAEGHRALVFSQFVQLLQSLRHELESRGIRYAYLDGKTRDRAAEVERFQNDDGPPLFLISLKAGGVGLNLTGADYVFLLDPWWNPAIEAQAIDRAHRLGQKNPVMAYRLIARDTVEEKVLAMQNRKRALAGAVVGDDSPPLAKLDQKELLKLFE